MPIEFQEKSIGIFVPPTAAGNYYSSADDVFTFVIQYPLFEEKSEGSRFPQIPQPLAEHYFDRL
jgi:hypothetical protein